LIDLGRWRKIEEDFVFEEQEKIIAFVKESLVVIEKASTQERKDLKLFDFLSKLFKYSDLVAERGDFYEAAGRLFIAAYYLEEYHPQESRDIYQKALEYYILSLNKKIKQGAFQDATNVSLKIANIFIKKLQNHEEELKYIQKAIELIQNQIEILKVGGNFRELCGKYQTLSILYEKINDFPNVISSAETAIDIGKSIKDYSIIANAYNILKLAYENMQNLKESQNITYQALDFFSKEASENEAKQEYILLSQLYQIIKNLHRNLNNQEKFIQFSRKEAGVYVELAKDGLIKNLEMTQIASYYRGAALCYKEFTKFSLDSASCFFAAGNYYLESKKYNEVASNYEDAAKMFEGLKKYNKAFDLYILAGKNANNSNNLKSAILNYISAESLIKFIKIDPTNIYNELMEFLKNLANIEQKSENHYVAGSLFIEAAYYTKKISYSNSEMMKNYLDLAQKNYWVAAKSENEIGKKSMKAYTFGLVCIICKFLKKEDNSIDALNLLNSMNTKTSLKYKNICQDISKCIDFNKPILLSDLDSNTVKLLNHENSSELKKLFEIICEITFDN
jgi:tetratricopeptide (TPR) repeat protein